VARAAGAAPGMAVRAVFADGSARARIEAVAAGEGIR
jgi:hypothetical protein